MRSPFHTKSSVPYLCSEHGETDRLRVAVLLSGRGSNLQALIDAHQLRQLPIQLVLAASDRIEAEGLRRAERAGVPTLALDPTPFTTRADYDAALFSRVAAYTPQLIVLAGFLRMLDPTVVAPWQGRMINIHPSLLPKYPGLRTHARVLAAGDTIHGASVHYVTAKLDGGPVIAQVIINTMPNDTPESLAARLLLREHVLLRACVDGIAQGRIALGEDGVTFDGISLINPLHLIADDHLHIL